MTIREYLRQDVIETLARHPTIRKVFLERGSKLALRAEKRVQYNSALELGGLYVLGMDERGAPCMERIGPSRHAQIPASVYDVPPLAPKDCEEAIRQFEASITRGRK